MQPGRARISGLGVPLLPVARCVGWVAPVRPTHGVFVLSCPLAGLRVCGVLGRLAPVHRCARMVCCVACAVSWATWLPFTGAPAGCVVLRVRCPGPLVSCSPVLPLGVLLCLCGVLGHLAPVHRCARSVFCVACAVSWATWLLFTGVPARCVVLRVWRPGPLGSCSAVCSLSVLCCVCGVLGHLAPVLRCARWVCCSVCGVLGHLAPVHRCACSVCCFACVVSWVTWLPVHRCARSVGCVACAVSRATWLLFTSVPARCVVLCMRCPGPPGPCSPVCSPGAFCCVCGFSGPPGSCSPVRPLGVLLRVCGVLGTLAPVHRCAHSVCCFACTLSWASWRSSIGVPARCVVWRVRCPGRLGSRSPVHPLRPLLCSCGGIGHLAPVHRCARSVCCFACAVSWATWLLFTGVPARCVVWRVRCPGPLGSCSPVRPLGVLLCVCGVLGPLAPTHGCAHSVCCFACAVSWPTWLLFTGVPARCVASRVQRSGPLGSHSPVCPPLVLFCVYGVLGLVAPVHRCARSVCCVVCAVSWATWLLFPCAPALSFALLVRCHRPLGSSSPLCPLGVLFCERGVLGHLAPVHRCARSVCCVACAVSWATWLLFTGAPAGCVVLCMRCPGPPGSCSPVSPLSAFCCVCGVLGHLAPVHLCACSVCCFACAASWAPWLPFTGVPNPCVVLRVRCPGPSGSCSLVCPLGVLCGVCGVLGYSAPVHRCARSVLCFARAVSWASWLPFTGVPARCVVLRVRCPGPPGSCSPVCPLGVLCFVYGVLGHLAPVHRSARSVLCVACTVSCATWLLFTGVPARCYVLRVRCPGSPGSCSPVCLLGVLCCVCGVLGRLATVHRCASSVGCVACTVSWAAWLLYTGALALCAVLWVARVMLLGRGVAAGRSLVHLDGGCS